ncbi:MAG: RrF2 family transcriptional regulator [bacterium]|jgi:Rrf2 family protein
MLTKTTESAVRALIFLALKEEEEPISPRLLAESLGESPTYMAKIMQRLVKSGILRAHRGVAGGVTLLVEPKEITLLDIVESCQGKILGDYCHDTNDLRVACAFHHAMYEVHKSTTELLRKWTLADLAEKPVHTLQGDHLTGCRMNGVCPKVRLKSK